MSARIEIIGVPGAGKTTLASALQSANLKMICERYRENPFWHSPADWPAKLLSRDIAFLLQHVEDITLTSRQNIPTICDFSLLSDCAFATSRLSQEEFRVYSGLFEIVTRDLPQAAAYIWLDLPADRILANVRSRNRTEERAVNRTDVDRLKLSVSNAMHFPPNNHVPSLRLEHHDAMAAAQFIISLDLARRY
jgi:deoxyguanosine kinase